MNARSTTGSLELATGLASVTRLIRQGKTWQAITQCRALLRTFPDSPDVVRCMGLACLEERRFADAELYLENALRLEPGSANLLNDLGVVHLRQKALDVALDYFIRALDTDPHYGHALGNLAALYTERSQPLRARPYLKRLIEVQPFFGVAFARAARNSLLLDDAEEAVRLGHKAVRLAPRLSEARLALAEALETRGRFRQAKFQYLSLLRHDPNQVTALAKLLSMRRTDIDECHVAATRELLDRADLPAADGAQLHLALARYYDQHGQYGEAFAHLQSGNSISWKKQAFDSALFSQAVDKIIAAFSEEYFRKCPSHNAASTRPIFIVGMPRSGTTLVEQILASHPAVVAGGELSTIINLAAEIGNSDGEPYPAGVRTLGCDGLAHQATSYLDRLAKISRHAQHVTDKMPFNFMHLGLIATLFPDATIVHCRRDPLDTCLSCYFTSFGENLLFAGDLEALGRYYRDYCRLMDHWRHVLPKPPFELGYECLVDDTENTMRSLLSFCRLEWDPACLEFYRTDRGIRTPSRWQVRQPIYNRSVGRWRHYEEQLEPLRAALSQIPQGSVDGEQQ